MCQIFTLAVNENYFWQANPNCQQFVIPSLIFYQTYIIMIFNYMTSNLCLHQRGFQTESYWNCVCVTTHAMEIQWHHNTICLAALPRDEKNSTSVIILYNKYYKFQTLRCIPCQHTYVLTETAVVPTSGTHLFQNTRGHTQHLRIHQSSSWKFSRRADGQAACRHPQTFHW